MTRFQKISLFFLRLSLGWLFFWSGITKVLDPKWSSVKYLDGAKTFPEFYHWLATPGILTIVDLLNEWGLTLLGIAIMLGIFMRLSSILGALLMLLYYLPILQFPHPDPRSFLVDQHIIYILALLTLASMRAGSVWGLENWSFKLSAFSKYPTLRRLLE